MKSLIITVYSAMTLCCLYNPTSALARARVEVSIGMHRRGEDHVKGRAVEPVRRYDPSKPCVFVTHGWQAFRNDSSITVIKAAYHARGMDQVFVVYWDDHSFDSYALAAARVRKVGAEVARYIDRLVEELGANPDDITLVGHSLGAHVMGTAGRKARARVGRIIGLDPAGPLFDLLKIPLNRGLRRSDAKLVEVVHTTSIVAGSLEQRGHVDFFPNGAVYQPGCPLFNECSHLRAYYFYGEAIRKPGTLLGVRCSSYILFVFGFCHGPVLEIGFNSSQPYVEGRYYLNTGSRSPYGLGLKGAKIEITK